MSATLDSLLAEATVLDRVRVLEAAIRHQVDESSLVGELAENERALELARVALAQLEQLLLVHEQSPVASCGPRLADLRVMVKSNLAARARRAGRLEEALELYLELGKTGQTSQTGDKLLLYRFGLNAGVVLLELGQRARALKHFRLTLDRMSSAGHERMRVKLLSNIAVALGTASVGERGIKSRRQLGEQTGEQTGALERLLATNQQPETAGAVLVQPLNANHHKFGLSLMASLAGARELASMRATLAALVNVDVCVHYARVAPESGGGGARDCVTQTSAPTSANKSDAARQVTSDKLERLICARELEVARALLMSCNLMNLAAGGRTRQLAPTIGGGGGGGGGGARGECTRLLATSASDRHRSLALELVASRTVGALTRRGRLRAALRSLARLAERLRAAPGGSNGRRAPLVASTLVRLAHRLASIPSTMSNVKSAELAAESASAALLNQANWQLTTGDERAAELNYGRALELEPYSWPANFNALVLAHHLGRHWDELPDVTRKLLASSPDWLERAAPRPLAEARLPLVQLHLALLFQRSAMEARAAVSFERLLLVASPARLAPELSLHASRRLEGEPARATELLARAHRLHHYHAPMAERLVALLVSQFEYRQAELVLANCLRQRPTQVRCHQLLAECCRRAADYERAVRIYRRAIELFPADLSCVRALARLADELGLAEERELCRTHLLALQSGAN